MESTGELFSGKLTMHDETAIGGVTMVTDNPHAPLGESPGRTAGSANQGPAPPQEWAATLDQLSRLTRVPALTPSWWTPRTAYCGNLETWTEPSSYSLDGMSQPGPDDPPVLWFQLGLAGWGHIHIDGERPKKIVPGSGCFALGSSNHRYHLPQESPGWTFAWIRVQHRWMVASVVKQMRDRGPLVTVAPDHSLSRAFLRLVRGALQKDYRDRFAVELAMSDFVLAYQRWVAEEHRRPADGLSLLDEVRTRVVAALPRAIGVDALAAGYDMSRGHFSHLFRACTGLTPARYATDVRINEAIRLLRETRYPLKVIASACGFANANHFGKVFRRFRHVTPRAFRRAAG